MPFLQAGMYSFGIVPPTTLFSTVTPLPRSSGRTLTIDVAVLAAATGLLDELAFAVRRLGDRFAIGDLRLAGVRLHLELAQHAVADDFQVQLAHAGDDRLAGFFVGEDAERRIFFREALERDAHLFLVDLGLRLDRP